MPLIPQAPIRQCDKPGCVETNGVGAYFVAAEGDTRARKVLLCATHAEPFEEMRHLGEDAPLREARTGGLNREMLSSITRTRR